MHFLHVCLESGSFPRSIRRRTFAGIFGGTGTLCRIVSQGDPHGMQNLQGEGSASSRPGFELRKRGLVSGGDAGKKPRIKGLVRTSDLSVGR
jgi:hypothetical protein